MTWKIPLYLRLRTETRPLRVSWLMMINFVLSVFIHTKLRAGGGINFPITEKSCHQRARRRRRRDGKREEAKSLLKFASRKLVTVNSVGGTTIQLKQIESTNHFHCFVRNPKQREKHFLPSICATLFPRWEQIVQFTWGGSSYIKLQRWTLSVWEHSTGLDYFKT